MSQLKMALVVPTKDRPDDLRTLFKSLKAQIRQADLVLIVDGSDNPIKSVLDEFPDLPFQYLPVRPPSLPKQRNAGIQALPDDVDWVGFLDDDLILEYDALEEMEKYILSQEEDVQGVGLTITNQPVSQTGAYNQVFMIGGEPGRILPSGFASAIPPIDESIDVDWLYGGATFWTLKVLRSFSFDEWFKGTGYLEDVDFSYGVSRAHKLRVCASAKCLHMSHPIRRAKQKSMGEWQITAWWYFVKKYKDFSTPAVLWGMFGVLLKNMLSAFLKLSVDAFLRARGNLNGLLKIANGTATKLTGFSK